MPWAPVAHCGVLHDHSLPRQGPVDVTNPHRAGRLPHASGRFEWVSRSKEAVYRESGEADYDEAGSPSEGAGGKQSEETPDGAVTNIRRASNAHAD
jgi:hypothetical protein